jgi:hypothetical protein
MPEPASPLRTPTSFATLLASLTGSGKQSEDQWDSSALGDDVATISYEQALRAHRRVRTAEPLPAASSEIQHQPSPASIPSPASNSVSATKRRKTASITIRITESEQAQLQERAAAAQLSVSAYLRSCIFEAESLRTQVKEALSQMSAAAPHDPQIAIPVDSGSANHRHFRFFSRWSRRQPSDG